MFYTDEKQALILIALLKAHQIDTVIASPGTTNMAFIGSIQTDPYFKVYSAVDERSAAYMACGLAAETARPVVLSCTGATASRNYLPGLTEAFYRKLPVLAVTSMQGRARAGHHVAQVIDRSSMPQDVVRLSVDLPVVRDEEDTWECEVKVNKAILELTRQGGGPAHVNLPTMYSDTFSPRPLPVVRKIDRIASGDSLPALKGRVGVFVGAHKRWTRQETEALDRFCESNNAAVFCDHTSGYSGKYRVLSALVGGQGDVDKSALRPDVFIYIGEISGDYFSHALVGKEVWRVSPDGELRDTFRKLSRVFEMTEEAFFRAYSDKPKGEMSYYRTCKAGLDATRGKLPDVPFSNIWLASQLAHRIPECAVVHFAILNSLRAWNFFELPTTVTSMSNVGGFGIDGCMSSLIGASLANPDRLFYLVTGDLAFFYDLNVLGNRHVGSNVRILLVNNGKGTEFTQHGHHGALYRHNADRFIAAGGHFGTKSPVLVKSFVEALGIDYFPVFGKADAESVLSSFVTPDKKDRPLLIEAFVNAEDESEALKTIRNVNQDKKARTRRAVKELIGADGIRVAKRILASITP